MPDSNAIGSTIKDYIMKEFLPDEDPADLTFDTELMTTGILDSLATINLVSFLEENFKVRIEAHETDAEYLNRIDDMVKLVAGKQGNSSESPG